MLLIPLALALGALAETATETAADATSAAAAAAAAAASESAAAWAKLTIKERIFAYDWTKEAVIVAILVAYVGLHFAGVRYNRSKVEGWLKTHSEVLEGQFFQVGTQTKQDELYIAESATTYYSYATGRLNASGMKINFEVISRQNLFNLVADFVMSAFFNGREPRDSVEIEITPAPDTTINPFIFAIVNKEEMKRARDENYFLSLTKTTDSAKLPPYLIFMSESPEVTDIVFTNKISEAVADSQNVLRFVAVTDQATEQPRSIGQTESRSRIVLSLKFPKSNKDKEVSNRLLEAALLLLDDAASTAPFRPEVTRKIKSTREVEVKKVQKALDSQKADELAQRKAEQKREQKSAASTKQEQKEREKELKRQRNKQNRRVRA